MTILRTTDQIAEASNADLLETYNALTGKNTTKFKSREAGKRQVEQAMMAARDADGHLGVPKGGEGEVKTAEELAEKAADKGQPAPDMSGGENPPADTRTEADKAFDNPHHGHADEPHEEPRAEDDGQPQLNAEGKPIFPPGSMADQLQKSADKTTAITKRPRATPPAGGNGKARPVATHVIWVPTGNSKVRDSSQRGAVLQRIKLGVADGKQVPVSIASLDAHFQVPTKGFLQKLQVHKHIEFCDDKGNIAVAPAATGTEGEAG